MVSIRLLMMMRYDAIGTKYSNIIDMLAVAVFVNKVVACCGGGELPASSPSISFLNAKEVGTAAVGQKPTRLAVVGTWDGTLKLGTGVCSCSHRSLSMLCWWRMISIIIKR
jgi:hypothetical protein